MYLHFPIYYLFHAETLKCLDSSFGETQLQVAAVMSLLLFHYLLLLILLHLLLFLLLHILLPFLLFLGSSYVLLASQRFTMKFSSHIVE